MIESISLENFKCFRKQYINFRNLTILAGLNASGKTTVIQSLLLTRQTLRDPSYVDQLVLRDHLGFVGKMSDLLFYGAEEDSIKIDIRFCNEDSPLQLHTKKIDTGSDSCSIHSIRKEFLKSLLRFSLFSNDFQFLEAERWGPRLFLNQSEHFVRSNREIGSKGEYIGQFLEEFDKQKLVNDVLKHRSEDSNTIALQIDAWLGDISPNVRVLHKSIPNIDAFQMRYAFAKERKVPDDFRATNVGFGISYALPVVVALLTPFPNNLLIIENPESHLHPYGQAALGRMIACAAAAGHQIIIETQSDHILNGIRVAVLEAILKPDQISTVFFTSKEDSLEPKVDFPKMDERGRYDFWPEGFFDQWEKSLKKLVKREQQ